MKFLKYAKNCLGTLKPVFDSYHTFDITLIRCYNDMCGVLKNKNKKRLELS